jgi:hypothetical protein
MMYELRIGPTVRETMALNATLLPRLIRDKRQVITKEMQTELSGMSHPGRTLVIIIKRAQWVQSLFQYIPTEEGAERHAAISREREHLTRSCSDVADCTTQAHENDQTRHDRRPSLVASRRVEGTDVRI